jgi:anthranilate phosphoribosyltransferase
LGGYNNPSIFKKKGAMIRDCLVKLSQKEPLTEAEAWDSTLEIFEGKASPAQVGAYLTFLSAKGETVEEVLGSMRAMREKMVRLQVDDLDAIDVCGTGGDHKGTFNISTTAALVLAGGGVAVAKHGNRAASSQCGSAEVLDALGVKIDPTTLVLEKCLRQAGIAFLFAPHFHPAMKNVGPLRKELGFRTIFNILGPLCNPASVKKQVIGVYDKAKAQLMGEVLVQAGSERVVTLHSQDGLDEVSCAAPTELYEYSSDPLRHPSKDGIRIIEPEQFGFENKPLEFIHGSDAAANAKILTDILEGQKGPYRDAVVMNAAVGFYVAGKCKRIPEGRPLAEESIDSKKALETLKKLVKLSHS